MHTGTRGQSFVASAFRRRRRFGLCEFGRIHCRIHLHGIQLKNATVYQITSAGPTVVKAATPPTPNCQAFVYSLPAMSVSTIVLD